MRPMQGLNNALVIDDTQSSNPESTVAALHWLGAIRDTRRSAVVVMGDVDSGDSLFQATRNLGETNAESSNVLITYGAGAPPIGRAAMDWGMDAQNIHNTYSTVGALQALLGGYGLTSSDVVLVKGGEPGELAPIVDGLLKQSTPAPSASLRTGLVRRSATIRPTWVEVDAGAIASNVRTLKEMVGPDVTLMAVVKADGYGHGAVLTSQTALANGAEFLGVSNIQEGLDLRNAGVIAPILVMGYSPSDSIRLAIQHNLQVSLYDLDLAKAYDLAARDAGQKLKVHVKIDTGLGRLGLSTDDTKALFRHLRGMQYLEIEGVYTHFSSADSDPVHTAQQARIFQGIVLPLQAAGFGFRYIHAANTAATVTLPDFHFNMVRVGGGLYGLNPSPDLTLSTEFKPAMTWKALVAQVRTLPKGSPVGYGNTYITTGEERIAVLAVGYADGLRREPHFGSVLIHGKHAPIIGRVSMEKTIVSVSHIPEVATGDEAVLLGRQGSENISASDIAERMRTISYDVATSVLARIPRR
jgi:alanine racemase